jgi:pimeloyl-ACP methyl ester carboxylesterase
VFAKTVIQDLFLRPSRLSMNKLSQRYFFPSALSKYETLSISNGNGTAEKLGVHYLEYSNPAEATNFDALYVNHGFGASSLSWLPAIPSLTKKIGAKVCLGHDAAGFGFTDRPESLESYSAAGSARIATNLLLQKSPSTPKSVALFGHSLGALTTLKMALQLPKETSKFIVLCAPALGLGKARLSSFSPTKRWWSPIGAAIRRGLVYPIFGYALRRAVG